MSKFQPRDPDYSSRVTAAFKSESASPQWGGELSAVSPGAVEIKLPLRDGSCINVVTQRPYIAALLEDACVLAALSLTSPGDLVTTVEYKVNFLSRASADCVVGRAEVVRPGRSITVCRADAFADGVLVARMLATMEVSRPSN